MKPTRPARVVVTRPAEQSGPWLVELGNRGIDAVALPLIDIVAVADPASLQAAWRSLPTRRLAVFVSANAVRHFFAARPAGATWPPTVLAAAPGLGTAGALREAGLDDAVVVAPPADAPQFDSESLWLRLRGHDWAGASALVVRGGGGRDWLAERLAEAGATVDRVDAYARSLPAFDVHARARLETLAGSGDVAWLFSSSQAITHLEQMAGFGRWGGATAIATHPRIAERARQAGFGRVVEAGPGIDAVMACIQSIRP